MSTVFPATAANLCTRTGAEPLSRVRTARRQCILDTAQTVFLREGYQGAAMERIAEEADVSKATLYKYFADKEELLVALVRERKIEQHQALFQRAIDTLAGSDRDEDLQAATLSMLHQCPSTTEIGLFRLLLEVAAEHPDLIVRIREQAMQENVQRLEQALRAHATDGQAHGIDCELLAHLVFAVVGGYNVQQIVLGNRRLPPERMAAALAFVLKQALRGEPATG